MPPWDSDIPFYRLFCESGSFSSFIGGDGMKERLGALRLRSDRRWLHGMECLYAAHYVS